MADTAPLYEFIGNDETGAAMCRWFCPYCGTAFERRKPCMSHMGLIPNLPFSCRTLIAEVEARRAGFRSEHGDQGSKYGR